MKPYRLTKEKFFREHEHAALVEKLEQRTPHQFRDTTLIYTALNTGARASELLDIRVSDLDEHERTVYIRGLKNSDDREVPIPDWLFDRLLLLAKQSPDDRIFPISYQRLDQVWHSFRTTKKKFHALRHTFAIRLYERTKDIKLVQMCLGHRDFENTLIYLNFAYKKSEMRRAMGL